MLVNRAAVKLPRLIFLESDPAFCLKMYERYAYVPDRRISATEVQHSRLGPISVRHQHQEHSEGNQRLLSSLPVAGTKQF